jgi:hypothetical protein
VLNLGGRKSDGGASGKIRPLNGLLIGLGIREALSFWTGHPFDFEIWIRLGYYVSKGLDPYRYTPPIAGLSIPGTGILPSIGYPPLWPILQALVYDVYSAVGIDNRFLYYFLIKQETIIPDIIAAYLILVLLRRTGRLKEAESAFVFWMLCPFVIIISAIWGMFDQLVLVFLLASLLVSRQTVKSSLLEGVGILLKGIPIIFLPIFTISQGSISKKVAYFLIAAGLTLAFTLLPYAILANWNIIGLQGTGTDIIHKTGNSINYWVVPFFLSSISLYNVSGSLLDLFGYLWIPALVVSYLICYRFLKKTGISLDGLVLCVLFSTLVLFLTRTQINEQYVIYFLGLGLVDIFSTGTTRTRNFHGVWISATVFLFANNVYMVRFLAPISSYYSDVASSLSGGVSGDVRLVLMLAAGLSFTFFCLAYLRSLYHQLSRPTKIGDNGVLLY